MSPKDRPEGERAPKRASAEGSPVTAATKPRPARAPYVRKRYWNEPTMGWWERAYSALYLKLPDERLTLILLANSEGLWWGKPLDGAEVEKSPFAAAFLRRFRSAR